MSDIDELLKRMDELDTENVIVKGSNTYEDEPELEDTEIAYNFRLADSTIRKLQSERDAAYAKGREDATQPCTALEIEYADDEEDVMGIATIFNEVSHGEHVATEGLLPREGAAKIINAFLAHRRALNKEVK